MSEAAPITLTTVYDNVDHHTKFKTDWGFGCVIDHPRARILFDTGAKPEVLKENLNVAGIDPHSINTVVISHKHWDHKGSVVWLAQKNPTLTIYMPRTFSTKLEKKLAPFCKNIVRVAKSLRLNDDFHLVVSQNVWIRELALAISTPKGALVVTGCSHTGVHKIASKVRSQTGSDIRGLFGGFHLFRSPVNDAQKIATSLKKAGVQGVAPCHCTGEKAITLLKETFAEQFFPNGVGARFVFE